jgi:hypothetical protein
VLRRRGVNDPEFDVRLKSDDLEVDKVVRLASENPGGAACASRWNSASLGVPVGKPMLVQMVGRGCGLQGAQARKGLAFAPMKARQAKEAPDVRVAIRPLP